MRGQRCPFEDCVEINVTAYETSGSRNNWGGPANIAATGYSPELSAQGATEADDGAAKSSGGSSLILFDLNGTLLFRPRQGASVAGAQSAVTEFPEGGTPLSPGKQVKIQVWGRRVPGRCQTSSCLAPLALFCVKHQRTKP